MEGSMVLIFNAVLLLGLISLNSIWGKSTKNQTTLTKIIYGIVFSVVVITVMIYRWEAVNGIFYDTRTIVLAVVALYYSPITIAIATVAAIGYRLYVGGIGTVAGITTIVCTVLIGILWKKYVVSHIKRNRFYMFLLYGLVIHIFMLLYHFVLPMPIESILIRINAIAPYLLTVFPIITALVLELIHITNEKISSFERLVESEEHYRLLFSSVPSGIFEFNTDGIILSCNDEFSVIIGTKKQKLVGMDMHIIPNEKFTTKLDKAIRGEKVVYKGAYHTFTSDKDLYVEVEFSPIYDDQGDIIGGLGIVQDLTQQVKTEESINILKNTCPITGLNNRKVYDEHLLSDLYESKHPLSYCILSINNFQFFIDSLGYNMADYLLREVGNVLRENKKDDATIYRVSEHDFVMIIENSTYDQAKACMKKLKKLVAQIDEFPTKLTVATSVAQKDSPEETWAEVSREAQLALQSEKLYTEDSISKRTIDILMASLFEKSPREKLHSDRVSDHASAVAEKLGLSSSGVEKVRLSAKLHDIGKLNIDEAILEKPVSLNNKEYDKIKMHTETGYRILSTVDEYKQISDVVLYHHENFDGTGYPKGIAGKEIPIESRIISVVDTYDAITSDRPYRKAKSKEFAISELKKCAGTQFDPDVVEAFLSIQLSNA